MRVKIADATAIGSLELQVKHILDVLADPNWGFGWAMVTDESCFSDFGITEEEFPQLSEDLGIALDPANEDDWWIYRVAAKLKVLAKT